MEENNAPVLQDEPVADEPQEPAQEQPEEPQQDDVPSQEVEKTPVEEETAEKPEDTAEEIDPDYDISSYFNQPPSQSIQPDENGYIDPNAFQRQLMSDVERRIEAKLQFERAEQKAWSTLEKRYPEITENTKLRNMIHNQRLADVAQGGKGDLYKVAKDVMGLLADSRNSGKAQATVSRKVQSSAGLQKNTANKADTSGESDLMERMSLGDETAKMALLESWLEQGKL